jgi:hypothetical protein
MKKIKKSIFIILGLTFLLSYPNFWYLRAQNQTPEKTAGEPDFWLLEGQVLDAQTRQAIAFANLYAGQGQGAVSDVNGFFSLKIKKQTPFQPQNLRISFIGYQTQNLLLDSVWFAAQALQNPKAGAQIGQKKKEQPTLIFYLVADTELLSEVLITDKKDPAYAIIEQVLKHKKRHNPYQNQAFSCEIYHKFSLLPIFPTTAKGDTTFKKNPFLDSMYLGLMESVSAYHYRKPDWIAEEILANRLSGFKEPRLAVLATQLQPFAFYEETFEILEKTYVSPIAEGTFNRYEFELQDTLFRPQDSLFLIRYAPMPNRNFNGLTGVLYVSSRGYALENVLAEPLASENNLIHFKWQQKYQLLTHYDTLRRNSFEKDSIIKTEKWFPEQLNISLQFKSYPSPDVQLRMEGKSFVQNVRFSNPQKIKSELLGFSFVKTPLSYTKDSLFWNRYRNIPLDERELRTYAVVDSIGEKLPLDLAMNLLGGLAVNRLPMGKLDILPHYLLGYSNDYEGFRLGLGAQSRFSRFFFLGGAAGYGFKDKAFKYRVWATAKFSNRAHLTLSYKNDVEESANRNWDNLWAMADPVLDFRRFRAFRFDAHRQWGALLSLRPQRYLKIELTGRESELRPQYAYAFASEEGAVLDSSRFKIRELGLQIRFAYKERLTEQFGKIVSLGTDAPVVWLTVQREILYQNYWKLQFDFEKTWKWKMWGETDLSLQVGKIWSEKSLPYPLLFDGGGIKNAIFYGLNPKKCFYTMPLYAFAAEQYAHIFLQHHFKELLLKTRYFAPQISVVHHLGWGLLSNREAHKHLQVQGYEKGYAEAGVQLRNLFKVNYRIYKIGFGLGGYYRYDSGKSSLWRNNAAFNLLVGLSW